MIEKKPNFAGALGEKCNVTNCLYDCPDRDSPLTCAEFTKTFTRVCKPIAAAPYLFQMHPPCHPHSRKLLQSLWWSDMGLAAFECCCPQPFCCRAGCSVLPRGLEVCFVCSCSLPAHPLWLWAQPRSEHQAEKGAMFAGHSSAGRGEFSTRGAAPGPAPVLHRVLPHGFCLPPSRSRKPHSPCLVVAAAAAIEGLCVSRHKVKIDAISPPLPARSGTTGCSHKGPPFLPPRLGYFWAVGRGNHTAPAVVPGIPRAPPSAFPRPTLLLLRILLGQRSAA